MNDVFRVLNNLKDGLIHSKRKKKFYDLFKKSLGEHATLALLGLNNRSNTSIAEIEMIAYIAERFKPIELINYNANINEQANVCFIGVSGEYKIRFDMQFHILNTSTGKPIHPDLKITIIQHFSSFEDDIGSIAIEYEGHDSHTKQDNAKPAFLRNRKISYQTGAPVIPYYPEEMKSRNSRNEMLNSLEIFIKNKIYDFEKSAKFSRIKFNNSLLKESTLVTCPVCEGAEKLGTLYCPECEGVGRVRKSKLPLINMVKYQDVECSFCRQHSGCFKCNHSGFISRERAIQIAIEEGKL